MSKNRPNIAEKIKFWEEQDKINQAFIPRVIEMGESLKKLSKQSLKNSTKITNQATKFDQLEKTVEKFSINLQKKSLDNEKLSKNLEKLSKQSLNNSDIVTDQASKIDQIENTLKKLSIELNELTVKDQDIKGSEESSQAFNKPVLAIAIIALIISILSLVF